MKRPMLATLLPMVAALAACTPSAQESAMHNPGRDSGNTDQGSSTTGSQTPDTAAPNSPAQVTRDQDRAAVGPSPAPVSAAENPLPAGPADSPLAAQGRRTLSTAFVQVGPDGLLTVQLRDGRILLLRNVVMRPNDYCGAQASGSSAGKQYCGGYADVAEARPNGAPLPSQN